MAERQRAVSIRLITKRRLLPKTQKEPEIVESDAQPSRSSSPQSEALQSPSRTCVVPGCLRQNCSLLSHHLYQGKQLSGQENSANSAAQAPHNSAAFAYTKKLLGSRGKQLSELKIGPKEVENLSTLPLEVECLREVGVLPEVTNLFNRFFCEYFDAIAELYYPSGGDLSAFRQVALGLALSEPIFCITIILQSHLHEVKDQISSRNPGSRLTSLLYTSVVQMCREMLAAPNGTHTDLLVLAISVACMLDISTGSVESLRMHRAGLAALSSQIGGCHNLGLSLPCALRVDRAVALVLDQPPLFMSASLPKSTLGGIVEMRRGKEFGLVHPESILRAEILESCQCTSGLIELFEADGKDACPNKGPIDADVALNRNSYHLSFLSETLDYQLTSLIVTTPDLSPFEECILLATQIIKSTAMLPDFLPALRMHLSIRIRERLSGASEQIPESSGHITWGGSNDILLWLLFACALPQATCSAHSRWVDRKIAEVAELHFRRPVLWQHRRKGKEAEEEEIASLQHEGPDWHHRKPSSTDIWFLLCKFIWFSGFASRFNEICRRIPNSISTDTRLVCGSFGCA